MHSKDVSDDARVGHRHDDDREEAWYADARLVTNTEARMIWCDALHSISRALICSATLRSARSYLTYFMQFYVLFLLSRLQKIRTKLQSEKRANLEIKATTPLCY